MGWIKSTGNLADGVTKMNKSDVLQETMRTRIINVAADQWVIRSAIDT